MSPSLDSWSPNDSTPVLSPRGRSPLIPSPRGSDSTRDLKHVARVVKAFRGADLRRTKRAILLDDDPAFVVDLLDRRGDRRPVGDPASDLGVEVRRRRPVLPLDVLELGMAEDELLRRVALEVFRRVAAVGHHAE